MKIYTTLQMSALWLLATVPLFGQSSVNCFLEDFESKSAVVPSYLLEGKTLATPTVIVTINANDTLGKLPKYLYGNNANTYMTQMVDQPNLINYITLLSPNVIRFPGGNLSSIYFWNATSQPPTDAPDSLIDGTTGKPTPSGYWYGNSSAAWTISVDNYYAMLNNTNSTGIITINYGYARYGMGPTPVATAAHYAADWVRYDGGRTMFWEIGNESDGAWQRGYQIDTKKNQDGQPAIVTGDLYGRHFKVFADSMRKAAQELGATIYIGAQLVHSYVSPPDANWNKGFFNQAGDSADFFILHNYFGPYNTNSAASVILNSAAPECQSIMQTVQQSTSTSKVSMKPVALTEWNINAVGSKQACSFINGMHAVLMLGELAKDGYSMASRWDLANGYSNGDDHGMFSMGDEPVSAPKWNPRPVFFYMYYFQKYFGDHLLNSSVSGSRDIVCYASSFASGEIGVVVVNKGSKGEMIRINIPDFGYGQRYYMYNLAGGTDNGNFSQSVYVNDHQPDNLTGGPINDLDGLKAWSDIVSKPVAFYSPEYSVQYILIDHGNNIIDKISDYELIKPKIFPNPAKDIITIVAPYNIDKIEITSLSGTVVKTVVPESFGNPIKLELKLPPAFYLLRTYNKLNASVSKLIIVE